MPVLDITLPLLCMTVSGSISTTAPYVRRLPMLSLNVSLTFCSTCGESSPFRPHCDVVSPTRSPVLAVRASTTMTMMWMWSERKRTERTFLANLARSEQPSGKNKRSPCIAPRAPRDRKTKIRPLIAYINDCSSLPNRTISLKA